MSDSGKTADMLIELEMTRARAITTKNWAAVDTITASDFTHTHSSGRVDGKAAYIEGLMKRPRGIERTNLSARVYGHAAILSGLMFNAPEGKEAPAERIPIQVMQVWIKGEKGWQVVGQQATRVAKEK